MLRRFLCALVVLGLGIGVASAERLRGRLVSVDVDGLKLKFKTFNKEAKKLDEAKEYKISDKVKVYRVTGTPKEPKQEEIGAGLKAKALAKIGEKGRPAAIDVDNGLVTGIHLPMFRKKTEKDKQP
jgi:hypothetical protein